MAILIENMEMPRGCAKCKFLHGLHRMKDNDGVNTLYVECRITDDWGFVSDSGRRKDCPLRRVEGKK